MKKNLADYMLEMLQVRKELQRRNPLKEGFDENRTHYHGDRWDTALWELKRKD